MGYKRHNGFTLIELVMTIAIIGIVSAGGAYMLINLVQSAVYIPSQLNMDMIASKALDIMIKGDEQARGLRFSRQITDIQPYRITFNNQDDQVIQYSLNTAENKLYRSIDGGPDAYVPYFASSNGINLKGKNGQF